MFRSGWAMVQRKLTTATTVVGEDDPEDKQLNTVGRPLPYLEVKIADPMTGRYYNDEQKTRECITDARWYKTGDVGVMDEDGYIDIVSRIKDMVIRGGENIYPAEVEEVLNTHPAVYESLVIGVPDERMGEELCAWILTRFKIPRYFIYNPNVPRTAIGKPQKAKMRPLAAEMLGLVK
ncbi:hypothetical protein MRX96_026641 [Rhipicephalus microplus]